MATEQADFWAGEFGSAYIGRNDSQQLLASNIKLFSEALASMKPIPQSILELGANIGMNYLALHQVAPGASFTGVEVNEVAARKLRELGPEVFHMSIEEFEADVSFDLVFTKGVLIHLNPESLIQTYRKMYRVSRKFIMLAEYYNPTPVAIDYRGEKDKLFKRDFAGEMMALFPDLYLRDYGFVYHLDTFPQDDITWFLLEKV